MDEPLTIGPAAAVRALIARRLLGDPHPSGAALGEIGLRPHQREAVTRLRAVMIELGGALLADEVGMGKTYVALAVARDATAPVVLAPAVLRPHWHEASARTGVSVRFTSYEALGRGRLPPDDADLVICDEAHHLRTPTTRRYAAAARLTARARVLLLSATPVHNQPRDLAALLSLFLGRAADAADEALLARCVIRRTRKAVAGASAGPAVAPLRWLPCGDEEELLAAICALPPPLPAADGGTAGALAAYTLVRQWASSRAALRESLRRRLARARALAAALSRGRHPSRTELAAWAYAGGALQLAFPELVASGADEGDVAALRTAVDRHASAVAALLARLGSDAGADAERAQRLAEVRAAHRGERVVAFAESAETVRALYALLRAIPGVAVLDGRGARVAGGPLTRADALARFAPRAHGRREPPAAERIELLLATDLLSEGVNLQDASVLVHLDRPWTPARLEQRVGRLTRPGAARSLVSVYALAPPAPAEELLQVERRLCEKVRAAARAVGVAGVILPAVGIEEPVAGGAPSQLAEEVREALRRWRAASEELPEPAGESCVVATVAAPMRGVLALVDGPEGPSLVAALGEPPHAATTDPRLVARAVALAGGTDAPADADAAMSAVRLVAAWCARRTAAGDLDVPTPLAPGRRDAWRRLAAAAARLPREQRPRLAPVLAAARSAVAGRLGAGAERVLAQLVAAPLGDEAWLRAVAAFGEAHRSTEPVAGGSDVPRPVALLVLRMAAP